MSFGQRMNMCNITFIVSSFGIFRILNVFKQLEKMCIGEMTFLENGFVIIPTLLKPAFSNTRMEGRLCSKTSANIRIVFV